MRVQHILSSKTEGSHDEGVATVRPGTSIGDAAKALSARRIGCLVVSPDGDQVSGILSERDIVRELGRSGAKCMSDLVDDLMTRDIVGCTLDDSADAVLQKMTNGRFRHMPVMEGTKMIGLISIGDVVKARLSELSMEKDALEGMIMGH